jgi:hypothetical protein
MRSFSLAAAVALLGLVSAASSSSTATTTTTTTPPPSVTSAPAVFASIVPGTNDYLYYGCYNETTRNPAAGDVRALANGNMVRRFGLLFRFHCFPVAVGRHAAQPDVLEARGCWAMDRCG